MPKSIKDYTDAELVKIANDNHIWLNAFAYIHPTNDFKIQLADMILEKLEHTDMRDHIGVSNMIILTINKS